MFLRKIISHSLPIFAFVLLAGGSTDSDSSISEPISFTSTNAGIYCKSVIKKLLRDPDSYKYESAYVMSNDVAVIQFRSKNGFGGYVQNRAKCTTYRQGEENWFRAELLN